MLLWLVFTTSKSQYNKNNFVTSVNPVFKESRQSFYLSFCLSVLHIDMCIFIKPILFKNLRYFIGSYKYSENSTLLVGQGFVLFILYMEYPSNMAETFPVKQHSFCDLYKTPTLSANFSYSRKWKSVLYTKCRPDQLNVCNNLFNSTAFPAI